MSPLDAARAFAAEDPDPDTQRELLQLIARVEAGDTAALADLADRFAAPLDFGTAGLRGRVEAGLARMNRVVVMRASWGLGRWLLEHPELEPARRGVVIGFDGRYSSRQFAEDTAAVLAGLGIPAHIFSDPVSTPFCAFTLTHLRAAAGVMVTASHNPPLDNGYKVYAANGAQIIPPADHEIAAWIARAPRIGELARPTPHAAAAAALRHSIDDSVELAYLEGLAQNAWRPRSPVPLNIVYTAMHGVGHRALVRALRRAGFDGIAVVPSQCDPDGAFRTVAFPNPEEKGAMDRALGLARETGAELVLANDPDADRLAVAVPDGSAYRMLTGNEIGFLLAEDALQHADSGGRKKLVITTIVSSSLLSRMAKNLGAAYAETLTGFKWIANAAIRSQAEGLAFVFGYEEALGYSCGTLVRDKDGIGAALRMAELARELKSHGQSLLGRLDALLVAHGLSHQVQWSVTLAGAEGKAKIEGAMAALRNAPPRTLNQSPVERSLDLASRQERLADGTTRPLELPSSNVLMFHGRDGGRLIVRPSGTEPKIKFYLELVGSASSTAEVPRVRAALDARCAEVKKELMAPLAL